MQTESENQETGRAEALLKKHEAIQHCYRCGTTFERLTHVIDHYHDTATQAISGAKQFRDRMIIDLRAMSIVLNTVGNADTHKEKSSRLRGSIEILESAIRRLEEESFDIATCSRFSGFDDVFRSDYPNKHYVQKIRSLEVEVANLKKPANVCVPAAGATAVFPWYCPQCGIRVANPDLCGVPGQCPGCNTTLLNSNPPIAT